MHAIGKSTSTHLKHSIWLAATILVSRSQVLPEQSVVQVAAAVEVEKRRNSGGLCEVTLGFGVANCLESTVETVDICLVVLGVVQLHDLARNVWLQGAVVICTRPTVNFHSHDRIHPPEANGRSRKRRITGNSCPLRGWTAPACGAAFIRHEAHVQDKSGSVALPRTNCVLAMVTGLAAAERRAPRRAGVVRRSVDDMIGLRN